MLAVQAGLRRTLDAADLIGVRDDVWLATDSIAALSEDDPEFFTKFRTEFPMRSLERREIDDYGARQIFRLFQWARAFYPAEVEACSQWVGYDLAIGKFWGEFLRSRKSIGLIHCSPHLPAKLSQATGVQVESILIPEKALHRSRWDGIVPDQAPHYPDAFMRVRDPTPSPL